MKATLQHPGAYIRQEKNNTVVAGKTTSHRSKTKMSGIRKFILLLSLLGSSYTLNAQMSGVYAIPSDFPTLAAAISSLNAVGVSSAVTINIPANYTETAPMNGYSLTATGTSANPITFQKSGTGANPLLTAYSGGTCTPSTALQDGVWRLIGSDFVTISNIDVVDPNTTNPATMEFGFGLFKAGATDGCSNVTIMNCVITLNRNNNASGIAPASDGSRGIDIVNALSSAHTTPLIISSAAGANSNNTITGNSIENCNVGISVNGYAATSPFTFSDSGNSIISNSIVNFGGATAAANPAAGIYVSQQQGISIIVNTINNNNGGGVNHPAELRGIYSGAAPQASVSIIANQVTLHGGGTTSQVTAIENAAGSSGTNNAILIQANQVKDCSYSTSSIGSFYGIFNSASSASMNISGNSFTNNSTAAFSGNYFSIYNTGAISADVRITGNTINIGTFNATSLNTNISSIYFDGGSATLKTLIAGNTLSNMNITGSNGASGDYSGIHYTADSDSCLISMNSFNNLNIKSTGNIYLIHHNSNTSHISVTGNWTSNGFTRTFNSGITYFYYDLSTGSGTESIRTNSITAFTQQGNAAFGGIVSSSSHLVTISDNLIANIITGSGTTSAITVWSSDPVYCDSNTISTISSSGILYGIRVEGGSTINRISGNTVSGLTSSGPTRVYPVFVENRTFADVVKNRIYNITSNNSAGLAYGIYLEGGTPTFNLPDRRVTNNLIGNISAPVSNNTLAVAGIFANGSLMEKIEVSYNTVYLNAAGTGTLSGSAALFASDQPDLTLRNNILVNLSAPSGTGITAAYRRSDTNMATHLPASDHNLFYAGTPGPSNLIFFDGSTSQQLLTSFKTFAGTDLASVTENPPFLSTNGSNAAFLDINPATPTQIESGAIPIPGVPDDYSGATRNVSVPDIGAWENNYTASNDLIPPTLLNMAILGSACNAASRTITLNLVDASGVAANLLAPRVYYRVNNGAYTSVQGTLMSGTALNGNWIFTMLYAATGSDVISFYVVAQDVSPNNNLMAFPGNGFTGFSVNSVVTPPSPTHTFVILPTPTIVVTPTTVCFNESTTLTASGAASYTWSGAGLFLPDTSSLSLSNVSNTAIAVYTIYAVSSGSCATTATTSLVTLALPVITVSASASTVCPGAPVRLTGGGGAAYSWTPGNMNTASVSVNPSVSTVYTLSGTGANGCVNTATASVSVQECTGVFALLETAGSIRIFPNPAADRVIIDLPMSGEKELVLTNSTGSVVYKSLLSAEQEIISLAQLAPGIYFIQVKNGSNTYNHKLIHY